MSYTPHAESNISDSSDLGKDSYFTIWLEYFKVFVVISATIDLQFVL